MISVIIPTYKATEALDLCLKSAIKGQKKINQIIVVVDGHYDINKEVLNKHSGYIDILNLKTNQGACKALNLGVYNAKHDKILIVNDDNVFPSNWDDTLEKNWKPNSVISPNQIEPYPSMFKDFIIKDLGKSINEFNLDDFYIFEKSISKSKQTKTGSTFPIFMSKLDYTRLGGFDEAYPSQAGYVTDWDFFLKCQLSGLEMVRIWDCHFYHFVALSNKSPEQSNQSQQEEKDCHFYAKYKWGNYIQHDPQTNLKYI